MSSNSVNVFILINNNKYPFGIQKQCRVSRMIEVLQETGIICNKIIHHRDKLMRLEGQQICYQNIY